jgi:hypothetical protein
MIKRNRTIKTERITTVLLFCITLWLSGCAQVAPWERGNLAKPQMSLDPYPMQSSLQTHVNSARESAAGGGAMTGGGCGCYQ